MHGGLPASDLGQAIAVYSFLGYQALEKVYTTAVDFYEPHPLMWLMDVIQAAKTLEVQHADEIEFMRPKGEGRPKKIPKGDVIKDEKFTLYVKAIKESGEYPNIEIPSFYWTVVDWKGKHIPGREACLRNHIAYRTIRDLEDKRFIEYQDV